MGKVGHEPRLEPCLSMLVIGSLSVMWTLLLFVHYALQYALLLSVHSCAGGALPKSLTLYHIRHVNSALKVLDT